jgi:hypothetical protein
MKTLTLKRRNGAAVDEATIAAFRLGSPNGAASL